MKVRRSYCPVAERVLLVPQRPGRIDAGGLDRVCTHGDQGTGQRDAAHRHERPWSKDSVTSNVLQPPLREKVRRRTAHEKRDADQHRHIRRKQPYNALDRRAEGLPDADLLRSPPHGEAGEANEAQKRKQRSRGPLRPLLITQRTGWIGPGRAVCVESSVGPNKQLAPASP